MKHLAWSIVLAGLVPSIASARQADADMACVVLEAAYARAIGSDGPAYPADIRPSWRTIDLAKWTPQFKERFAFTRLALNAAEFDDLAAHEQTYAIPDYRPSCAPAVGPSRKEDAQGHRQFVSFTAPVFSSDLALAIVEVSFQEEGIFGYGMVCTVRNAAGGQAKWTARCLDSWVS
jgi:hypothetical protein